MNISSTLTLHKKQINNEVRAVENFAICGTNLSFYYCQLLCGAFYLPTLLSASWVTSGQLQYMEEGIDFTALTIDKVFGAPIAYVGTADGQILQVI